VPTRGVMHNAIYNLGTTSDKIVLPFCNANIDEKAGYCICMFSEMNDDIREGSGR
jgi:hypothetical protein